MSRRSSGNTTTDTVNISDSKYDYTPFGPVGGVAARGIAKLHSRPANPPPQQPSAATAAAAAASASSAAASQPPPATSLTLTVSTSQRGSFTSSGTATTATALLTSPPSPAPGAFIPPNYSTPTPPPVNPSSSAATAAASTAPAAPYSYADYSLTSISTVGSSFYSNARPPPIERRESLSLAPYAAMQSGGGGAAGAGTRVWTIFDADELRESNKPTGDEPLPDEQFPPQLAASSGVGVGADTSDWSTVRTADSDGLGGSAAGGGLTSLISGMDDGADDPFELALSGLSVADVQSAVNSPYLLYLLRTDSLGAARRLVEGTNERIDVTLSDDKGFTCFIHLAGQSKSEAEGTPLMNEQITAIFHALVARIPVPLAAISTTATTATAIGTIAAGDALECSAKASVLNAVTQRGNSALMFACRADGRELVANLLLDHHPAIDLDISNVDYGGTALREAIHAKREALSIRLIQLGADVNVQDKKGCTPLMLAIEKSCLEVVRVLLTRVTSGLDPTVRDAQGRTAIDRMKEEKEVDNNSRESWLLVRFWLLQANSLFAQYSVRVKKLIRACLQQRRMELPHPVPTHPRGGGGGGGGTVSNTPPPITALLLSPPPSPHHALSLFATPPPVSGSAAALNASALLSALPASVSASAAALSPLAANCMPKEVVEIVLSYHA